MKLLKSLLKFLGIGSAYPTYYYKDETNVSEKEKRDEPN